MIKAVGIALILMSGTALGFFASKYLDQQVRRLEQLEGFLHALMVRLEYTLAPTGELIRDVAGMEQFAGVKFLQDCSARCERGESFPDSWKAAVEGGRAQRTPEENRLMLEIGGILGSYDADSQIAELRSILARLEVCRKAAEEHRKQRAKLYRSLGMLGAAAIAVLFL